MHLKYHITSVCKVRKHGTIIYRKNQDLLLVVSQLLWKVKNLDKKQNSKTTCSTSTTSNSENNTAITLHDRMQVLDDLNHRIH